MRTKSLLILLLIMVVVLPAGFKFEGSSVPEVSALTLPADSSGRLIIGFKDLTSKFPIQDFLAKYGGGQVAGMNYVLRFAVVVPGNAASFMRLALQDPRVSYIEPDGVVYAAFTPNDPSFSSQWGPPAIQATGAWDITLGLKSVIVAVVDTGVQYDHPDLSSNMWKNSDGTYGCNYVNFYGTYSSSCGNTNVKDDNGHGTHVAGIVAATINNGIGVAGISQSSIMAVKVLDYRGSGYWSWIAYGIQWATDHGAKIINLSLAGSSASQTLQNAVTYAYGGGVLLVAAAGNSGGTIQYPASYDQVIAVTAVDQNSNIASFSSRGSKAELTAPGVSVYSTYYGSKYTSMSGTSMAAPFVSGVAALVWSVDSSLSRDAVRSLLGSTADDLGSPGRDSYYGYGRVNAYGAVLAAGGTPPPPDFTLSLSASALTVTTGKSGDVSAQVKGSGGFADPVTLSTEGLPAEVTSSFAPSDTGVPDFTATLTISASDNAVPGDYPITVKGDAGGKTKTQTLSLKVVSASSQLLVTVATDKPTYPRFYATIYLTVRVTDGNGNAISGAYVVISIYSPSGALFKKITGYTDASGYFKTNFRVTYFSATGTYSVTATATKTGYLDGTATTTFKV